MSPANPITLLIGQLASFGSLSEQDQDLLHAMPIKSRLVRAGEHVLREGDETDGCAIITAGFAIGYKTTSKGDKQIVSLSLPGEASGLHSLFLTVANLSIQALVRSKFAILPAAFKSTISSSAAIGHAAFASVSAESAIAREWMLNVGRKDARASMAHFFCELFVRLKRQGLTVGSGFEIPLTQDQIGDVLGLTAVHVNRTMRVLLDDGLITKNGRIITIERWAELCNAGGFTYRYLSSSQEGHSALRTLVASV